MRSLYILLRITKLSERRRRKQWIAQKTSGGSIETLLGGHGEVKR